MAERPYRGIPADIGRCGQGGGTEKLTKYEEYQKLMEESGQLQISLMVADAKMMRSKNGFAVVYNPQTVVDSKTHRIRDF